MRRISYCFIILLIGLSQGQSQQDASSIKVFIEEAKEDARGPYHRIKWFCEDSTIREARDPCPEPLKGVQHATYKPFVTNLAKNQHIFLDQILVAAQKVQFWDDYHNQDRLKQYQITNYLFNEDDGWILRKGQYYRGAKQIEDERMWGQEFLEWACSSTNRINENFLSLREASLAVPHGEENDAAQKVRIYSKKLADLDERFMNLRTKIHGSPDRLDLDRTVHWVDLVCDELSKEEEVIAQNLITSMIEVYSSTYDELLQEILANIDKSSPLGQSLVRFNDEALFHAKKEQAFMACELMADIRFFLKDVSRPAVQVMLLDFSHELERMVVSNLASRKYQSLSDMHDAFCFLQKALYGGGYIEEWELHESIYATDWLVGQRVSLPHLKEYMEAQNKLVHWSSLMISSHYQESLSKFLQFEPKSYGFIDDKIRSSAILPFSNTLEQLVAFFDKEITNRNQVLGGQRGEKAKGLNPGVAYGRLNVILGDEENIKEKTDEIYAFYRPPHDLKPVAGILNVTEGNPISHIQLLARNLSIPNVQISNNILDNLKKYDGQKVFLAVSADGTVVLKKEEEMSEAEKSIFTQKEKEKNTITISTDRLNLTPDTLLRLNSVNSSFSGVWCGPKAANLGQLKAMFPSEVVDGIVIPFGVFKEHMQQNIPGIAESYWTFLNRIFRDQQIMISNGEERDEIECVAIQELELLRQYILKMPLKQSLIDHLENHFEVVFGQSLGDVPVFLRSDTNMEDLPNFSGAGLNLTLFNIVDRSTILDGIKKVWASPYTERSYKWRQQILSNPQDVYPSILIIPSVNVDKSGVIITKGLSAGGENDLQVSFSRGVGGAVDGQMAETYVISKNKKVNLITPSREYKYRTIPSTGGSVFQYSTFTQPVLDRREKARLFNIAHTVSHKMDSITNNKDIYDIELGIKDGNIWLFQVRPFVESKDNVGITYLTELRSEVPEKFVTLD